jgi:YidC/Oxa1 family membrane protein insertase
MNIFDTFFVNPLINVVAALYHLVNALNIPYALGFAIILVTVLIKIVLYPLTVMQLKASRQMQELAPQLSKIKEKYKGDTKRQQEETMALYRTSGFNPAAGCLPAFIPLPIFLGLYWALDKIVKADSVEDINRLLYFDWLKLDTLWDTTFFGIPLGKSPAELWAAFGALVLLVPVITGLLQLVQSKMMTPSASALPKVKKKEPGSPEDFSVVMQKQMVLLLPVIIGYATYSFPFGLSLYWNTFAIFGIIQQYRIQGLGGLSDWLKYLKWNK